MYTDHIIGSEEHETWLEGALHGHSSRFLIFEISGEPAGMVSFTAITPVPSVGSSSCLWAFYLGEADTPKGTGSVMELLALDHAFGELMIRKLSCEVIASNNAVVRLHEKFGFTVEGTLRGQVLKNGAYEDVILLALFAEEWPAARGAIIDRYYS